MPKGEKNKQMDLDTLITCVVFLATYLSNLLVVCHYQKGGDCWKNTDYVLIMQNLINMYLWYFINSFCVLISVWFIRNARQQSIKIYVLSIKHK